MQNTYFGCGNSSASVVPFVYTKQGISSAAMALVEVVQSSTGGVVNAFTHASASPPPNSAETETRIVIYFMLRQTRVAIRRVCHKIGASVQAVEYIKWPG